MHAACSSDELAEDLDERGHPDRLQEYLRVSTAVSQVCEQYLDTVKALPFAVDSDQAAAGQVNPELWIASCSQMQAELWAVTICIEHIGSRHDGKIVAGRLPDGSYDYSGATYSNEYLGQEVPVVTHQGGLPDASAMLKALLAAMAEPSTNTGPPHRPLQIVLAYRLKDAYEEIRGVLECCEVACVLETKEEAKRSAAEHGTDYLGRNSVLHGLGLNEVHSSDESESEEESTEEHFADGDWVEIHGLTGAPQHNGKHGRVRRFIARTERYEIQVDGEENTRLRVRGANLKPAVGPDSFIYNADRIGDAGLHLCGASVLSEADKARRVIFAEQDDPDGYDDVHKLSLRQLSSMIYELTDPRFRNESLSDQFMMHYNDDSLSGYEGYVEWAIPVDENNLLKTMMSSMQTQFMYGMPSSLGGEVLEKPGIQLKQLMAVPVVAALDHRSETQEHAALCEQLFLLRVKLSSRNAGDEHEVWRRLSVFGGTRLDTLHDKILGPAMGWTRHYHSYMFIVPTNGACFGPATSGSVDQMHFHSKSCFTLDDYKYCLAHLLREPGAKLVYLYDLGDSWYHTITLEQVVPVGGTVKVSMGDTGIPRRYADHRFKLRGVQLIDGEINCPPEDSSGIEEGMGKYDGLLAKGEDFVSDEAWQATNWREHGIRNAFAFDLVAHSRRVRKAVADKSSAKFGQRLYTQSVNPGHGADFMSHHHFGHNPSDHADVRHDEGSSETVKRKPDEAVDACCALCGRQEQPNTDKRALMKCAQCQSVYYCGRECQKEHWSEHKQDCKHFQFEFVERSSRAVSTVRRARARDSSSDLSEDEWKMRMLERSEELFRILEHENAGENAGFDPRISATIEMEQALAHETDPSILRVGARAAKDKGNTLFRIGNQKCFDLAKKQYTLAVDALHALETIGGMQAIDGTEYRELTMSDTLLLATSLSNRAQCYLNIGSAALGLDERSTAAHHAVDDCTYARGLAVQSAVFFTNCNGEFDQSGIDFEKAAKKAQARLEKAQNILASCTEQTRRIGQMQGQATGQGTEARSPAPAPAAAPAPVPASATPARIGDTGHTCVQCGEDKPKDDYTRNQWKKRKAAARCKACVAAADAQKARQARDEAAAKLERCDDLAEWLAYHGLSRCLDELLRHSFDMDVMRILAAEGERGYAEAAFEDAAFDGSDGAALVALVCVPAEAMLPEPEPEPAPESVPESASEPEPEPAPAPEQIQIALPAIVTASRIVQAVAHAGNECPVCLEKWADLADAAVVGLECQHAACFECVDQYRVTCKESWTDLDASDGSPIRTAWECFLCKRDLPDEKLLEALHASFTP